MHTISQEQARNIAVNAQLLSGECLPPGKKNTLQMIEKLGYVQIDTIPVINRSHQHVLWTRQKNYSKEILHSLLADDREVFEYWGHAMSYLPMSSYRYYLKRMQNFKNPNHKWVKEQLQKCEHLMDSVLERIRSEGPLSSKDFSHKTGKKAGTWWDWKPAKFALELLFWQGELMVAARRNFQKVYDLTERILPGSLDLSAPADEETALFLVRCGISAMGIASEKELQKFMQPDAARDSDFQAVSREEITRAVKNLVEKDEIVPVTLAGSKDPLNYAAADFDKSLKAGKKSQPQVHLLSPFDNLIIQRDRLKRLFNFDYSLECYTPAAKRKYGYFVLPILWGNRFAGRLDPKADRKAKTLVIKNLVFEADFENFDEFLPGFAKKLAALAVFNGCKKVKIEKISVKNIKTVLNKMVRVELAE